MANRVRRLKKRAFPMYDSATVRLSCRLLVTPGASPILSGMPHAERERLFFRKAEKLKKSSLQIKSMKRPADYI